MWADVQHILLLQVLLLRTAVYLIKGVLSQNVHIFI